MVSVQKINLAKSIQNARFSPVSNPLSKTPLVKNLPQWGLPVAASAAAFGVLLGTKSPKVEKVNGVSYDKFTQNLNFTVPSKNATHINLYLFDKPVDGKVIKTVEMKKKGDKWS